MKRVLLFTVTVFLTTMFFSCNNNTRENVNTKEYIESSAFWVGDIYELASTPIELLTDEQLKVAMSLAMLVKKSITLSGDSLINTSTPEEFEELGIPNFYYHLLQEILEGMNREIRYGSNAEEVYSNLMTTLGDFLELHEE